MMYESSLPVWLVILIVDLFVAIVCGLLGPYVPKKDMELADAYLHNNRKGEKPVVIVSIRGFFGYTALIVSALASVSVVAFIFNGFDAAVVSAGGGLLAIILVAFGTFCVYILVSVALILIAMLAGFMMAFEIEKYYSGHYGVEVKQDIY